MGCAVVAKVQNASIRSTPCSSITDQPKWYASRMHPRGKDDKWIFHDIDLLDPMSMSFIEASDDNSPL